MSEQQNPETETPAEDPALEAPEAPQEPETAPTDPEPTDTVNAPENGGDEPEAPAEDTPPAEDTGYLGTLAPNEGPDAIKTVTEAAPEGVSDDPATAVVGDVADKRLNVEKAVPLRDTKALPLHGQQYRQGYFGTLPGNPEAREDLSLGAVVKRDHPNASEGDTGQPVQGN